jgi:hypothetical protein
MTGSRSVTKPVAVLVSVMMVAATLALGPAAVAGATGAADAQATPQQTIPDELGRETRLVQTALKCSADGGSFGPLAIPFDVPIDVESPTSIQKGKTYDVVISAQAVEVPADFEGLPVTINNFTGLNLRALVSGGFEVVSISADTNSGFYQPGGISNPNAPKQFINPNGSQLFYNAPTSEVRLQLPGPFNGNSVIKPPNIRARVRAVGDNGDLITSQLGGTIPQQQTVFPWPSFSFNVTVSASLAGITTITAPAYCAPNYGRYTDIPGNDVRPVPFLSRTVIDDRGPDLNFVTPRDGFVYDVYNPETNPDSRQLIADFSCTDPSGVTSCVMTDADGNVVVPGQRLPDTSNNDGELTLRATDEFGFTSERTIQYAVSSNSVPNVDAGDDVFAGTLKRVELSGNATDVDFGQLISYRWIQLSGPAVTLAPTDDPFDTEVSFITPPGPEELVFALRADDGQGYAEDTVSVFVDPNNAPQIANKQFQFLGFCPFGELADDQRCDDTPIPTRSSVTMDVTATDIENDELGIPLTYSWKQVDENGNDLDPENPELVTLSSTDSPVVSFDAPQLSRELTLYFQAVVSDGDPRAEVIAEITVRIRRNLEPVFGGEGAEQVIEGVANGAPVRMQALATDPEGRPVTYAWRQVDENGDDLPEGDPALVDLTIVDPGAIADFTSSQSADPYKLYFRVVASDGLDLGDAEASIEVQVLGNEPPNFTNLAPPVPDGDVFNVFNVLNRDSIDIDASGTDPEGRDLTYAWRQIDADGNDIDDTNPDWTPIADPTSAAQSFAGPDTSDERSFYYAVVMSDGVSNGTVEAFVQVTFGPNLPPTLEGGYEQFVSDIETRGEVVLDGTATDPEGGTVSYSWSQVDGDGNPIDPGSSDVVTLTDTDQPTLTFTAPDTSLAVQLFFKLTVSDGLAGGSADALFIVSIRGNNPPVITAPAEQSGVSGLEVTLDGSATDLDITNGDNQTLSWSWVQVTDAAGDTPVATDDPTYLALSDANVEAPTFTPAISNEELTRYFRLTVSDGFDPVVLVVTVTLSANNAPVADAGEDQTVPRGTSVTLNGSGTDPDGHSIGAYEWSQVDAEGNPLDPADPTLVVLSATDITGPTFTAPNLGTEDVVLYFELLVYDEFGQVSEEASTVTITVRNQVPTADAGADQSGQAANSTVAITGSATDADLPFAVTYLWEQVDAEGNPVTDPETGDTTDTYLEIADPTAASTSFVTPQTSSSATYYLRLTVTDDGGLTATDTVAIQVNPVTLATPNVVPGTSGTVGSYIQLAMPRPGAPDNASDNFTYDWYQTDSAGSTTACAPTCIGGTAVIHTEGTFGAYTAEPRRPVIEVPGRADRNPANSFFRVRVADTFGGGDLFGAAVTITTTNTDPSVEWSIRGWGSDATARPWTDSTPNNPVWAAGPANSDYDGTIVLDATQNPAVTAVTEDLDADTLTYTWKQYNNPYTWGTTYRNKTAAVAVVTSNFNIPGGNRNCSNINLGGVNNLANGARVLLVGQNNPAQNGMWIVPNRSGTGFFGFCRNNGGQWARAGDLNSSSELEYARIPVSSGSGAGQTWVLQLFSNQISVDSTALNFQQESVAGPAGGSEAIFFELANTGRNTDTPRLRATQSGSESNTVTNSSGIAYLRTPVSSQFPLELTVTDGVSTPQSFRMVVRTSETPNSAPVATRTSSASQTIRGGISATLDPVTLGATVDDAQARPASSWPVFGTSADENLGAQSLTYQWLQTDAAGDELAEDDPDRVVIANPDPTVLGQVASATSVDTTFIPPTETKTLHFRVRTSDGIRTTLSEVQTVVVQINRIAPVADAGEAQDDVLADQTVTLDGSGSSDEDGTIDAYLWEQVDEFGDPVTSGPTLVTLSDPTAVSPTFTAPSLVDGDADLYFRLTVTDDFGDTDTDTVRIGVLEDGSPTAVARFSPDPVVLGQTATLSGEGSSDPEGQTLSYSWVQEDGSGNALATDDVDYVELTGATTRDATFTVPAREFASTLYFRLTVADGAATPQDDSQLVTIEVAANLPPEAAASASPSPAGAGQTVTLSSEGTTDPEDDTLTYLWEQVDDLGDPVTSGDTFVTLSDATAASPTLTAPGLTVASTLYFRLTVTDQYGAFDIAPVVTLEVAANEAPVVDASGSPNPADPGDEVTLSAGATDPEDAAPLTFAWTQTGPGGDPLGVDDPVVTLSDDTAAEPTFTAPGRLDAYTLYFEVVVTDEFGADTTDTVSVAVNANRAPTVTGSASPNPSPAGATVTLTADGTDADGDDITYAWVQVDELGDPVSGDDLVTLSATDTAEVTFQAPDRLTESILRFRVTVSDPYAATGTTTVVATITPNRLPTIEGSASPSDPQAGATVTLNGTATDPEGRDMTYQWTQVDGSGDPVVDGVTITDATTLAATFEAPGYDDPTDLFFELSVTDDTGVPVTTTVTVNVQANEAPVASISGSAAIAPPGAEVMLDGTNSSDPEGDPIAAYAWSQTSGTEVTIVDPTAAMTSIITPVTSGGLVIIELVVTDRWGKQSSGATLAVALQPNNNPFADAGETDTGRLPGETITLDGSGSMDADGHEISFLWTQLSGPDATLSDNTAEQPTFVPLVGGDYLFELIVADQFGGISNPAYVLVKVNANRNPVVDAGADQSDVVAATVATLSGTVSDPDVEGGADQPITSVWTQVAGDPVTLEGDDDLTKTFRVPSTDADQTLTFRLTTDDGVYGGSAFDEVSIFVQANRVPTVDAGDDQDDVVASTVATLEATVTDADIEAGADQTLTYAWTQVAGDPVTLEGDDDLTKTFRVPSTDADQTLTFRLTSGDGTGEGFDEVSINVLANRVPTVDAGDDQDDVVASTVATLEATVTDADIEAGADQTLSYAWTQVAGDPVTLEGDDDLTKTFRVPATDTPQTLTFRLTSGDGTGEGFDEVSINVLANRVPTVDAGEDKTDIVVATTVTLEGTAEDDDVDDGADQVLIVGWQQVDPVTGDPVDPAASLIPVPYLGTSVEFEAPSSATAQELKFVFGASDDIGENQFDEVSVFVNANRVPVVDAGSAQSGIAANELVTLSGSATDPDIDEGANQTIGGYTWSQVSGTAVSIVPSGDGSSATFNAPSETTGEALVFQLAASDGTGEGTATVTVSVNANRAPTADAGEDQADVEANAPVTLTGVGTDEDPQNLTYLWEQIAGDAVSGLSDPTQPTITFNTPINNDPQALTFRLSVSDGTDTTTDEVIVGVKANRAPVADAGPSQNEVGSESMVSLDGRASLDPEGQTLTYSWTQSAGTPVTLTGADTAQPTFMAPLTVVGASLQFTLRVTDPQGLSSDDTVGITVVPNRPPVADAGESQLVPRRRTVTLDGTGSSDPDGQAITYAWVQVDGPGSSTLVTPDNPYFVALSDVSAAQPTFLSPAPLNDGDEIYFMLVVVDTTGRVSQPSWTTVTLNLNDPPVVTPGEPQTGIAHNQTVTLGVTIDDPDGEESFTYQWTQIDESDNPIVPTSDIRDVAVELSDPTAEAPTFTAPYLPETTTLRFAVVVTDIEGASDDTVVSVEVLANRAPVVTMATDLTGQAANASVDISGSATDPDGDDIVYEWAQVDDDGEVIEPTADVTDIGVELSTTEGTSTSFTTPIINSATTLRFRLRATDSEGAVTDGFMTVGVNANRVPAPLFDPGVYRDKGTVRVVVTSNFNIPGGNRNCSDINLGGVNNLANGDRVLLVGQNNPAQNGVWIVPNRSGTGFFGSCSNNGGQWGRAGDLDSADELEISKVRVTSGSGTNQIWVLPLAAGEISVNSTALGYVRIENVGARPIPLGLTAAGNRSVGQTVTLSYPGVAEGSDPDGTSSSLFSYTIARVPDASSTTPCADATCGGTGLAATVSPVDGSDGREATFVVPGVSTTTPMYFRMFIDDGFGGVYASAVLTVNLQNTAPSINNNTSRDLIRVVAGADVRLDDAGSVLGGLERTVMGGPGEGPVSPNNVFNDGRPGSNGNFFPNTTYVYGGVRVLLDARPLAAAADPDGGAEVRFQSGLQPVGTAINLDNGLGVTTRNPNGVCQAGFVLQQTAVPNVWAFTPPTGVTENGGFCRIQFQISDPFTSPTTWGVPVGCLSSGLQTLVGIGEFLGLIPSGTLPPCTEPNAYLHVGDRNQNEFARAANVTLNRSADFWLQVFQNVAQPLAAVDEIPTRVFSSSPGQEPTLVTLDGSDTIDADGTDGVRPEQPLLYEWTALDPATLQELPDDADANLRIVDRSSLVTQFALPDSGPEVYRFRLDVYDGNLRDVIDTGRMRVTVRRPVADGTATLAGGDPQGTPADNPYPTAIPNVEVGEVRAGESVALSGAGSANPDGRTLKYQWSILSGGANAEIQSPRSSDATLVVGEPTLEGEAESEPLVVELTVRDGFSSAYKTFTFTNVKTEEPPVYCPDPTSSANYPFTDVGRNTTLGQTLTCLLANGVVSPNSRFNPTNTFTRSQMILVLHRLAGKPTGFPRANFVDVPNTGEVRDALNWANAPSVGLVSNQASRLFRPSDPMRRVEFLQLLHRYIGTPAPADPGPSVTITDLPTSTNARNATIFMAQQGVIANTGAFNPQASTQRGYMAEVVWKFGQINEPPLWQINPSVWEPRAAVNEIESEDGDAVTVSCPSPATLGTYPFGDVPADAAYRTATACLVENGVLSANPAFNPNGTFTRGQMLLVLHRLAGRPGGYAMAPFGDVGGAGELRDAVNWGFAEGLVSAQADGRFRPGDAMRRVELALFLWRSIGRPAVAPDGPAVGIVDLPASGESRDAVTYLAQRGVVEPTGFFNPYGATLRSAMAETVFRFGQIRTPALWQADPGVWQPRS